MTRDLVYKPILGFLIRERFGDNIGSFGDDLRSLSNEISEGDEGFFIKTLVFLLLSSMFYVLLFFSFSFRMVYVIFLGLQFSQIMNSRLGFGL